MSSEAKIAVVGLACKYPDADDPRQLWENILAKRQAFRTIPPQRLNENYFSADSGMSDYIYTRKAAVLKNYEFDRVSYKISQSNFKTADLAHWLALEVAGLALKDAGLHNLALSVREKTGVILGNTLTGDESRANLLRLRWPYFAATLSATLKQQGWTEEDVNGLLKATEENFKRPFPKMEEDSLAGGLSNTIAGRICNYHDFKGGGFTIDGACSSSLLAVAKACDAIVNNELLIALAGGVDLSLDPFELVGFSRAGALARKEMLVYDKNANGFWPGEGCGFIVLANYAFAKANNLNILACVKGWGISSDGSGGLTRPEVNGQSLALQRAYTKAAYGIDTVSYFEGHGTGTPTGDLTELSAIIKLLSDNQPKEPAYIGSVKANIGHTKAAAGVAGLIKAILALKNRVIPPATGNYMPHPVFAQQPHLQLPEKEMHYNRKHPFRAGVSSMGFGGINTHITLEEENIHTAAAGKNGNGLSTAASAYQDTELFLLSAEDTAALQTRLAMLQTAAKYASRAELTDISCTLFARLQPQHSFRVAIEASTPEMLEAKIEKLLPVIGVKDRYAEYEEGIFYANHHRNLRVGLLFPGQGNDILQSGALLSRRFPFVQELMPAYLHNRIGKNELMHTRVAQPALVSTAITGVKLLQRLGINAGVALGHSVGEISALYWGGILDEETAVRLSQFRGELMHAEAGVKGQMASVRLSPSNTQLKELLEVTGISVACMNTPMQTVLSGSTEAMQAAAAFCKEKNIEFTPLKVENAFHSKLMEKLEAPFAQFIGSLPFQRPDGMVFSTVSGNAIGSGEEAQANLFRQLTMPVRFYETFANAENQADVWVEAGAGSTLSNMVKNFSEAKVITLDLSGHTVKGLLRVAGLLFTSGNSVQLETLFKNRFHRAFDFAQTPKFIESPCELAEAVMLEKATGGEEKITVEKQAPAVNGSGDLGLLFKQALGNKLGLTVDSFTDEDRMLNDFHLNSLYVVQFLKDFAKDHNLVSTDTPLDYANATVGDIVGMFKSLNGGDGQPAQNPAAASPKTETIEGVEAWVMPFATRYTEQALPAETANAGPVPIAAVEGEMPVFLQNEWINRPPDAEGALVVFVKTGDALNVLVNAVQTAKTRNSRQLLFVQEEPLCNAFAKSLFAETPGIAVKVITLPQNEWNMPLLQAELQSMNGYQEFYYRNGQRLRPEMHWLDNRERRKSVLPNHNDLVLVTGGAKGITLECVRALGLETGCGFVLLGKSNPETDELLRNNLASLSASHIRFQYYSCDVTQAESVEQWARAFRQTRETITGVVHAAGINKPARAEQLRTEDLLRTLAPKLNGLRHVLQNIDTAALKYCFSFGSIIGDSGMEGNADYGLANQWLQNEMRQLAQLHPQTVYLNIAWSVWGGTGMGEHLGVLEALKRKGIQPISLDSGIKMFLQLLQAPPAETSIIVSGRYGDARTLYTAPPPQHLVYRFTEQVKIFYAGVELVADCEISPHTDWYLKDHVVEGNLMFPAVMGMEAMLQGVAYLTGQEPAAAAIQNLELLYPIMAGENSPEKIRLIVQRENDGQFVAVLRCQSTAFKKDHFRAIIVPAEPAVVSARLPEFNTAIAGFDCKEDLYGTILFHTGIFQCVHEYHKIGPYKCIAKAAAATSVGYFSAYMPKRLLSGSPVVNDAVMHAIQVCVPDKILLPVNCESIRFLSLEPPQGAVTIAAEEIAATADEYTYNITVAGANGQLLQQWQGMVFRAMNRKMATYLPALLLKVQMQRKLDRFTGSANGARLYLNESADGLEIVKRTDGKPITAGKYLAKSHTGSTGIIIESASEVACDVEEIKQQPAESWAGVLGENNMALARYIQQETRENLSSAATRVWCAYECVRKAGMEAFTPIVYVSAGNPEEVILSAGNARIFTCKYYNRDTNSQDMLAFLVTANGNGKHE